MLVAQKLMRLQSYRCWKEKVEEVGNSHGSNLHDDDDEDTHMEMFIPMKSRRQCWGQKFLTCFDETSLVRN